MTEEKPSSSLHRRIVENMQAMETPELLEIWRKNDRSEWSNEAFEVIRQVLAERHVDIPERGMVESGPASADRGEDADAPQGEASGRDMYHDPDAILTIASLAALASKVILGLGIALIVLRFLSDVRFNSSDIAMLGMERFVYTTAYGVLANALGPIVYFFLLQGISHVLYLLLDIEENSHRARLGRD